MKVPDPYLLNIRDLTNQIIKYTDGLNQSDYKKDRLTQNATIMIEVKVGRFIKRLNELFADRYPQLDLSNFPNLQNINQSSMVDIDVGQSYQAAIQDIPKLKQQLQPLLDELDSSPKEQSA